MKDLDICYNKLPRRFYAQNSVLFTMSYRNGGGNNQQNKNAQPQT